MRSKVSFKIRIIGEYDYAVYAIYSGNFVHNVGQIG